MLFDLNQDNYIISMYKLNVKIKPRRIHLSIVIFISIILLLSCKKKEVPVLFTAPVTERWDNLSEVIYYSAGGNIISDGNSPVISRGVCWSSNPSPTILDARTMDGTGIGDFESTIRDFSHLTTYYVRAYATNDIGTAYGNQNSFTTPCVFSPDRVIHVSLYSPSDGAIGQSLNTTLQWLFFNIGIWPSDVYLGTSQNQLTKIAANITSQIHILNGLIVGTTYYWRIIAKDKNYPCNNDTSEIYHFTTIDNTK